MLGIIFAMEEEAAEFRKHVVDEKENIYAGLKVYSGLVNDKPIVYSVSGIGKVNAGMAAQILISIFDVRQLINIGLAGSLNKSYKRGDIVLASRLYQHDYDLTAFGYEYGEIPNIKEIIPSQHMLESFESILHEHGEKDDLNWGVGTIVSGDQFISSSKKKSSILKHFNDAVCCEMEGAAIGQVAQLNFVEYAVLRCISDSGDEEAADTFNTFLEDSVKIFTDILLDYISQFA